MSRLKKISEWIISIFVVLVFIISAIAMIAAINGSKTGVNSVFGKVMNTVQSDSMEDIMFEGDLIFGTVYEGQPLEVGQIVTFNQKKNGVVFQNTHRIVAVEQMGVTTVYQTKGDHEVDVDPGYRLASDIVAVYDDVRIPGVGHFIDWLKEPVGFIICVILPIVAVILFEAYKIVSTILKVKEEERVAVAAQETSDDVKAEIIKQYLASQAAGDKKENPDGAEKPSDPPTARSQGSEDTRDDPKTE